MGFIIGTSLIVLLYSSLVFFSVNSLTYTCQLGFQQQLVIVMLMSGNGPQLLVSGQ